jgi:hypothetical protein
MSKKFYFVVLLLFMAVSFFQPYLPVAAAIPMQELFDGENIIIGDKIFDDWELFEVDIETEETIVEPDFSLINVIPLNDDPNNPGLMFDLNGEMVLSTPGINLFAFGYSVATLDGAQRIKDNSLLLTAADYSGESQDIAAVILEVVYDESDNEIGDKAVGYFPAEGLEELQLFDFVEFDQIHSEIYVETLVGVAQFDDVPIDFLYIDSFEQRFSQTQPVPEPGTILLLGSGLMGLVGFRKIFNK